jgi:hypothetical protein
MLAEKAESARSSPMSQAPETRATKAREAFRRGSWYFRPEDLAGPRAAGAGEGLSAAAMTKQEENELRAQLARLRQEHRDLDAAIEALQIVPGTDILQIQRLKKRKLVLRDRITFIEDQLTPDIIA